jgi:hypothetical protein
MTKATHSMTAFKMFYSRGHEEMANRIGIHGELSLLVEIEDVMDEIAALRLVLHSQQESLARLEAIFVESSRHRAALLSRNAHFVQTQLDRLRLMEEMASRAQTKLLHIIDLKHKHTSFAVALSAHDQAKSMVENTAIQLRMAQDTARQGTTLMVFTVATIVFVSGGHDALERTTIGHALTDSARLA